MIDLFAFDGATTAIRARIGLVGDRLTDLLAAGHALEATEVELVDLRADRTEEVPPRLIDPASLAIVVATGPRGSRSRRVETATRPVSLAVGPFVVYGYLHAPSPTDPVARALDRPWIPLTEAVLEYRGCERMRRERFDTLLVNRDAAKALSVIDEASHEVHWLASKRSAVFPEPEPADGLLVGV